MLVGYFITSYPTRAHGIIVSYPFYMGISTRVRVAKILQCVNCVINYLCVKQDDTPHHHPFVTVLGDLTVVSVKEALQIDKEMVIMKCTRRVGI